MNPAPRLETWSYSGEAWTDGDGTATILLPAFVRSHRLGFAYELTTIGSRKGASVIEEIDNGRFTIAAAPNVKVAWKITPLTAASAPSSVQPHRKATPQKATRPAATKRKEHK
jgi:hypothetical protein